MLETDNDKTLSFVAFHRIPLDEEFFPASIIRRHFWCNSIFKGRTHRRLSEQICVIPTAVCNYT